MSNTLKNNTLKNTFTGNKRIADIANNTICLALKKIKGEYTGDCLRLRRDSDDAESDFGFDANDDVDTSAISTWGTTDTLYIVSWYDQSGWGNDANQTSDANQPTWDNTNKKIIFTAASANYLIVTNHTTINVGTDDFSYVAKTSFTTIPSSFNICFKGTFTTPRTYIRMVYYSGSLKFAIEDVAAPEENTIYDSVTTSTDYNLIGMKDGNNLKAYKNGTLDDTTAISSSYGSVDTPTNLILSEFSNSSMTALLLFKKALDTAEVAAVNEEL